MTSFNVGDHVYVNPTGDPDIDRFLGQQMTIVRIEKIQADRHHSFLSYTVQSGDGASVTVLDCEMEYRSG